MGGNLRDSRRTVLTAVGSDLLLSEGSFVGFGGSLAIVSNSGEGGAWGCLEQHSKDSLSFRSKNFLGSSSWANKPETQSILHSD